MSDRAPSSTFTYFLLLSISLFFVHRADAEAQSGEAVLGLSLDRALELASAKAPEVSAARQAIEQAEARRVGAGIVMPVNPRLSVEARPSVSPSAPGVGYAAIVDVLFEVGGAPRARTREAEAHATVAKADLVVERFHARLRAWEAYVRTRIAVQRVEQGRALVDVGRRVLEAAHQRALAGAAGEVDESIARLEAAQLETSMESASRLRDAFAMDLRDALDLPATQPIALTTAIGEPTPARAVPALLDRALATRPELAAIRTRIDLLLVTHDRLERELVPKVGFYGGVDSAPSAGTYGVLGVSVELPFAQRNQGARAQVESAAQGERLRLELEGRRVARDVVAAREAYEGRLAELKVLTDIAVPASERAFALVEAGWKAGALDVFRVTTAAHEMARAISLRLDALEAAWMERIALARAVGEVV